MWILCSGEALMHGDIRLAKINTKPQFENANCKFYHEQIPKAAKMKKIPTWKQHEGAWAGVSSTFSAG